MKKALMAVMAAALAAPLAFSPAPAEANSQAAKVVNQFRAQMGRAPLKYSRKLERAAQVHAQELEARGVLDHKSRNGASPGDRAKSTGYKWCYVSENLASGPWDLSGVVQAWSQSPYHAKNLFSPKAHEFGIYKTAGGYWVMVLARPGCR